MERNHAIVVKVFELFAPKGINERNAESRYIHFCFLCFCISNKEWLAVNVSRP